MKISKSTLGILRNFASINTNILFVPGNELLTISASKSLYASVVIPEEFKVQFGIYDLNEFLSVASLFEDADFDFSEKYVTISEGKNSVRYFGAAEEVLTFPKKKIKAPPADIEFKLTADQLSMITRTAGVLKAPDVIIKGESSTLSILIGDKKNVTGNSYTMEIGETDSTFKANIRFDNLKMLAGDYTVELASKKIARFTNNSLEYIVVLEQDSEFQD